MAGDHGLRLRRLRQVLYLPDDAGEIKGGEIVLRLFDRDEGERWQRYAASLEPGASGISDDPGFHIQSRRSHR